MEHTQKKSNLILHYPQFLARSRLTIRAHCLAMNTDGASVTAGHLKRPLCVLMVLLSVSGPLRGGSFFIPVSGWPLDGGFLGSHLNEAKSFRTIPSARGLSVSDFHREEKEEMSFRRDNGVSESSGSSPPIKVASCDSESETFVGFWRTLICIDSFMPVALFKRGWLWAVVKHFLEKDEKMVI